jgi:hypothetical protein
VLVHIKTNPESTSLVAGREKPFSRVFLKLRKESAGFLMSVCLSVLPSILPSVRPSDPTERIFMNFLDEDFSKIVEKIQGFIKIL